MDFSSIKRFATGHKVGVLLLFLSLFFEAMPSVFFLDHEEMIGLMNEDAARECRRNEIISVRNIACIRRCRLEGCLGRCAFERCQCFGLNCDIDCTANRRRYGCPDYCKCQNSNECRYITGDCYCDDGWRGLDCSEPCPEGSYGKTCSQICRCKNNATCHHISGRCNCAAGYQGPYCDQKCPVGSHGYECSDICKCQNDATCHHVDGSCDCGPGWFGPVCAERCPDGFFGINCSGLCDCTNNSTCNFVTGECNCADGFYGNSCEVQCFSKEWGKDRSQTCESSNVDCATNNETCLPGFHGANCSKLDCDEKWGQNCFNECICKNGGLCHPVTGTCCCKRPWTGEDCSVHSKAHFSKQSEEKSGVRSSVIVSAICIPVTTLLLVVIGALLYRKFSVGIRNDGTNSVIPRFSRLREEKSETDVLPENR